MHQTYKWQVLSDFKMQQYTNLGSKIGRLSELSTSNLHESLYHRRHIQLFVLSYIWFTWVITNERLALANSQSLYYDTGTSDICVDITL